MLTTDYREQTVFSDCVHYHANILRLGRCKKLKTILVSSQFMFELLVLDLPIGVAHDSVASFH